MTPTATMSLRRKLALTSALGVSLGVFASPAQAQTVVDALTPGASGATVTSAGLPGTPVNVTVTANRAVVNWTQFNVPNGTTANFINAANGTTAVVLNRVTGPATVPVVGGPNTSDLSGTINAVNSLIPGTGPGLGNLNLPQTAGVEVWVSNPHGIIMGATGNFNTQGFVATTLRFSDAAAGAFASGGSVTLTASDVNGSSLQGITGTAGQIITNGRVLALIAPVVQLGGGTFNAGAGDAAFVAASQVTMANPGSPLAMTIDAGTNLASTGTGNRNALDLAGAVNAGNAYMVVTAQDMVNALLNVSADVTTASNVNGVVVLGGNFPAAGPIAITTSGTGNSGTVDVTTGGALTANGGGSVNIGNGGTGAITANGTLTTVGGGQVTLGSTAGPVTVAGGVAATGLYSVSGSSVVLGTAATTVVQGSTAGVNVNAFGGTVSSAGDLRLSSGSLLQIGSTTGTTGVSLTGSTLNAGNGTQNVRIDTTDGSGTFALGNVTALQLLADSGAGLGGVNRTGAVTTGDLSLAGTNTIATTSTLQTGAVATGGNLTLTGAAGVTVGGSIANIGANTGSVTVNGNVGAGFVSLQGSSLAGDLVVAAGTGGVTFTDLAGSGAKILGSAGDIGGTSINGGIVGLSTTAASTVTVSGNIGATTAATSVDLSGPGAVTIGTANATTTTLQTTGTFSAGLLGGGFRPGSVTVNGNTVANAVNLTVNGPVAFNGTVNSTGTAGGFTVDAGTAAVTLGGAVGTGTGGAFASFSSVGTGDVNLNGGALTTTGAQNYAGALVLGADTTLAGSAATFNGVTGNNRDLTLNFSGAQTLTGTGVAGSNPITGVKNLTTNAAGSTTLVGLIQTSGTQSYNDPVTLGGVPGTTVDLRSTGAGAAGNITFGGTVDGGRALSVTTPGTLTFGGAVGQLTPVNLILASGAAAVQIQGNVTTTNGQTYSATTLNGASDVVLTVNAAANPISFTSLNGPRGATLNTAGTTSILGTTTTPLAFITTNAGGTTVVDGTVATVGDQTYNDTLVLNGTTTLSATTGRAVFGGGVTGNGNDLTLNTGGAQALGATVTGVRNLLTNAAGTLTLTGNITTTGTQTYNDPTTLAATLTLNAGGNAITFNNTLASTNEAQGLTAASPVFFNGDVGGTLGGGVRLASLTAQQGATLGGTGTRTIRTVGAQDYGTVAGGLTLNTAGALVGSGGSIGTGITGNGNDLTVTFSADNTLSEVFGSVGNLTVNGAGVTTVDGDLTTLGSQTFVSSVTLSQSVTFKSTNNGAISFNTLTGAGNSLTVTTAGTTTFNSGATGVNTLVTDGGGTTVLNATMGTTVAQDYRENVVLGSATTAQSNGTIRFGGTVTGAQALTLNSPGQKTFAGAVGPLASIQSLGTGAVVTTGGSITTTGNQSYASTLVLGANTTVATTNPGSTVTLSGVNGLTGGINRDLTINSSGALALNGTVVGVRNLTTDAPGTLSLTGSITTTGNQSYGENVTLAGATTLTAGAASTISFGGTVNGAQTLATSAQQTTFNADVGNTAAPISLQVTGIAATAGTGPRTITTAGAQSFGGQLALGVDTVLVGTGATFGGGVNGSTNNYGLTLTFSGANALGADPFSNVGALLVNGTGTTTLNGNVTTVGTQTWTSAINVAAATILQSSGNGGITLNTVGGNSALTVTTSGATNLNGTVGGITALTTNGGGTTMINTGTITTTSGVQSYADNVVLGVNTALTANGAAGTSGITFGGTVTGPRTLTVNSAGATTFNGVVGATVGGAIDAAASPTALTSSGAGAVVINGGAITTNGAQSYAGQVRLGADTVLTGTAGTFTGGVAGNGFDLRLNFTNPTVVNGGFGGIDDLAIDNAASLSGAVTTNGSQTYNGAVTLAGTTTLQSGATGTNTGNISFNSTLDGAQALTITTAGTTSLGSVGAGTPLASLTVNGTGPITLRGPGIATTGAQSYAGPVTLGANNLLTTTGSNISFGGTVDGAFQLSVRTAPTGNPAAGTVSFGGAVGGTTALTGLAIRAQAATANSAGNRVGTLAALVNTGGFTFADAAALTIGTVDGLVGVNTGTGAATITSGGLLTVANNVTGVGATLTGTGVTANAGTVVNAGAGTVTIDGNDGALALNGSVVTTNATANAALVRDASSATLGTISTGAGGTLTLGGAGTDNIGGTVTQLAGTILTAGTLAGNVGGAATLTNANAIGTLGAFSATGLALRVSGGLVVTGPVDTRTGDLTLTVDGAPLALQGAVTTGGTATFTVGGAVTQTAGSVLTANTLTGSTAGGVALTGQNQVANLGAFTVATGGFQLTNARALTVTTNETINGNLNLSAVGLDFSGRTLTATGNATLAAGSGALTGTTVIAANITGSGNTIAIGDATAGNGTAGTLTLNAVNSLQLTNGTAGQAIALSSTNGPLTTTGTLQAGTTGTATATSVSAVSGGVTNVNVARSFNGGLTVNGGTASLADGTATNGALAMAASAGGVTLGTANAGSATLTATGTVTGGVDSGTIGVGTLTTPGAATLTSTGAQTLGTIDAGGTATLRTTNTGDIGFTALQGAGAKALTSASGISGGTITGAGAVSLAASTASPITVTSIGTATGLVASLTVNGGSVATFGPSGTADPTLNVQGNTRIGQSADGATTGSLVINGRTNSVGSFTSTTTGATSLGALTSTGALNATTGTGGALGFDSLAGGGAKTLTSGGSIAGGAIDGSGAVTLTAAGGSALTTGAIGGTTQVGAVTVNGGNAVTIGAVGGTTGINSSGAVSIGATTAPATITVNGAIGTTGLTTRSTGTTDLDDVTVNGAGGTATLTTTGTGDVIFGALTSAGAQTITSAAGITGTSLGGGGAVRLIAGTTNPVSIGTVGTTALPTASLTVSGGSTVTFGTAGSTGDTLVIGGNTRIGQSADGAATGALVINGRTTSTGSFTSTTTGATSLDALNSTGALTATSGGALGFSNLGGNGAKTLTSGAGIAGTNITATGAVSLTAASGSPITVTGAIGTGTAAVGAVTINGGSAVTIGTAGNTGNALNSSGAVSIGATTAPATLTINGSIGGTGLTTRSTGTTDLDDVTLTGGGAATLTTTGTGAVVFGTLTTAGAQTIASAAGITGTGLNGGGAIKLTAGTASPVSIGTIGATTAAASLTINGGSSVTLGAANATATTTTVNVAGAVRVGQAADGPATASLTINGRSAEASLTTNTTGATTLGTTASGGVVTVTAGGAAVLGQTTAATAVTVAAASINAGATAANGGALTLTSTGALTLASGTASGNAAFDAGGTASLGAVTAGTNAAITVRALDAAITGAQKAASVTFTNRAPTTTAIKIGDNASSGGFALSQAEVNFVDAAQLTIDGGAGNVEFGTMAFNAAAGRTRVDVLSTGRIDVTGSVSGNGTGRTFRLGGTGTATDKASVIRVVSTNVLTANGAAPASPGGQLLFDTADLDLRGARIGVGQAGGFLDAIGFGPGQTALSATTVGADYIGNPNSSLYNATYGGTTYATGAQLITAHSLTVRYTDYALFQNTGTPGLNQGVTLGAAASPAQPALVLQATGSPNAFALFGTINGISDTGAAVSGSAVIQVAGADLANTRINGCLAGSGAGCLTSVVSQPLLNVFDPSRLAVFRAADDLALPFDPVVGTNNEALFSGFGLIDSPITDTECSNDTTSPNCAQNKEQGK